MEQTWWVIETTGEEKFPYRLSVRKGNALLLCLRVQDRWPGTRGQIFCVREEKWDFPPPLEEVEKVPVVSLKRYGKRLAIILDREKNKRCDFLFLTKEYKTREGEYEQIFWRTQQALTQRRPRVKLSTYGDYSLEITISSDERYPYRFPVCLTRREALPVGDYALKDSEGILAVVERKTFENLVAEFGRMSAFHQVLAELESYRHSALVIEANYSDFLNPDKMRFYPPVFGARALAELFAFHHRMHIIFAGNRKLGQEWCFRFFSAIGSHYQDTPHPKIAEVVSRYGNPPETTGGQYYQVKKVIEEIPDSFTINDLRKKCPDCSDRTIRSALNDLKKEGRLTCFGKGPSAYWQKVKGSPGT